MKSPLLILPLAAIVLAAPLAGANTAPAVVIQSAAMRPGTTLMDVVYRVNDPDDATVKTRALAFVDGVRSFSNVIRPVTFVEGTAAKLGDAIPANVDHTLTWDVATDWDIDLGQVKFEVLAMDGRGLLPFDWLTIPAAGGDPEVTISVNSPTSGEVLDAYFWLYASGDPGLELADGMARGGADSGIFHGVALVNGTGLRGYATPYVLKKMNLAAAGRAAVSAALSARSSIASTDSWHALSSPWQDVDLLVSWGAVSFDPPEGVDDVIAIAAGWNDGLALLSDGSVVGWGNSLPPPDDLANVTAIAAGERFGLALLSDTTVVGWGIDMGGRATPPAGLTDVTAIAVGRDHSLALLGNGTVVGWGSDSAGKATPPAGLTDVTAIDAGERHSLALLSDRTVVGWGSFTTPPSGLSNVTAIAAGQHHNLALLDDGTVVGWGRDDEGQASPPAGLANVTAIAAGPNHSLALLDDGTVVGWGRDIDGQASPPAGLTNVAAIAGGALGFAGNFSLALVKAEP